MFTARLYVCSLYLRNISSNDLAAFLHYSSAKQWMKSGAKPEADRKNSGG
jgi:hypothetical protein